MEQKALQMKIQGVGVACFLDTTSSEVDWIGEMKVVQTPYNLKEGWNLVAIAWSKAGEVIASVTNWLLHSVVRFQKRIWKLQNLEWKNLKSMRSRELYWK